MKKFFQLMVQMASYHLFMTFMRFKDREFSRRFARIRQLHRSNAPQWQMDREIHGLDTYMRAKYFRHVSK
jgi:hypothetical protein